jgi:hypothetical protein
MPGYIARSFSVLTRKAFARIATNETATISNTVSLLFSESSSKGYGFKNIIAGTRKRTNPVNRCRSVCTIVFEIIRSKIFLTK